MTVAKFRVQYLRRSVVIDRYSIEVEADNEQDAKVRVALWDEISDDELETDTHEREVEQVDSQPIGIA
jgi:hypothetical protein